MEPFFLFSNMEAFKTYQSTNFDGEYEKNFEIIFNQLFGFFSGVETSCAKMSLPISSGNQPDYFNINVSTYISINS